MLSKDNPQSRQDNLVVQEIEGEVLIYDLKVNKAFCLNDTSAQVWQACDGTKSVTEISQLISKEQNSPVGEDFVWLALDQLKKNDLLSNSEEIVPNFNGMSRREVVKKVGLSTMIAIPFIVSLTAPLAANAQASGSVAMCRSQSDGIGNDFNKTLNGGSCGGNGNCCSNNCTAGRCEPRIARTTAAATATPGTTTATPGTTTATPGTTTATTATCRQQAGGTGNGNLILNGGVCNGNGNCCSNRCCKKPDNAPTGICSDRFAACPN